MICNIELSLPNQLTHIFLLREWWIEAVISTVRRSRPWSWIPIFTGSVRARYSSALVSLLI